MKPPNVLTNAELSAELEKLRDRVQKLEFDIGILKAENEGFRRKLNEHGR